MFNLLLLYRQEKGHCNVPKQQGQLGTFVDRQRTLKRMNRLPDKQVAMLNSIGFVWQMRKPLTMRDTTLNDQYFEEMLKELKKFKEEEGHCWVPQKYLKHPKLGNWVKNQRKDKRHGTMKAEREQKLNEIGFEWL